MNRCAISMWKSWNAIFNWMTHFRLICSSLCRWIVLCFRSFSIKFGSFHRHQKMKMRKNLSEIRCAWSESSLDRSSSFFRFTFLLMLKVSMRSDLVDSKIYARRESHPVNRSPRKKIWQVCCEKDFNQAHWLHHVSIESDRIRFFVPVNQVDGFISEKSRTEVFWIFVVHIFLLLLLKLNNQFDCSWVIFIGLFMYDQRYSIVSLCLTPNDHQAIWLH